MLAEKGVTLIALVITLIIIFVLVGLGLGIITGEGGLFRRAFQATIEYHGGAEEEADKISGLNTFLDEYE